MFCVLSAFIAVLMQNLPVVNINSSNHRVDGKSSGQGEDHLKLRFVPEAALAQCLLWDAQSMPVMSIHIHLRARRASWQNQATARACFNDTTAPDRAGVLSLERILPANTTFVRRATDPRIHAPRRRQPQPSPATIRLHSTTCSSTTTNSCLGQSRTIYSPAYRAVLA